MINYQSSLVSSIYDSMLDPTSKKNNFHLRQKNTVINLVVIHYTVLNFKDSYRVLTTEGNVSVHYIIDLDGSIHQVVSERHKAWHAGISSWKTEGINENSIGIELVNPGSGDKECFPTRFEIPITDPEKCKVNYFPQDQISALSKLLHDIIKRHEGNILSSGIVGHSDIAPNRKIDPGAYFPWESLAKEGLGLYFDSSADKNAMEAVTLLDNDIVLLKKRLSNIGYKITNQASDFDEEFANIIRAFKMHFVQDSSFSWDEWTNYCDTRLVQIEANQHLLEL